MLVSSLEQMEKIVNKNKDLFWDGWTVVHSYQSDKARTSRYGALVNGKWHLQRRIEPTEAGWELPNRFAGKNE